MTTNSTSNSTSKLLKILREKELCSIGEVAQLFDVATWMVRSWLRQGLLPGAKLPGSRLIRIPTGSVLRLYDDYLRELFG